MLITLFVSCNRTSNCPDDLGNQVAIVSEINGSWRRIKYGHLSKVFVKKGDHVKKGQVLGTLGKTGNACADHIIPHTHVFVREYNNVTDNISGSYFDPLDYLNTQFDNNADRIDSTYCNN